MEVSSDPYEQKLFQMFQSCDSENSGLLNETAIRRLCEMLELQDNGSVLMDDLASRGHSKSYVTFAIFKEALLKFLGTELDANTTNSSSLTQKAGTTSTRRDRILILSDKSESYNDSAEESSEREVSPKFVVGSKKYGRRSRPHMVIDNTTPSDSESETVRSVNSCNTLVQRSSSQSDIAAFRRRRPALSDHKLKRCASLPTQNHKLISKENTSEIEAPSLQDSSSQSAFVNNSVEPTEFDFSNLTNIIHAIWQVFGSEVGTHYLNCQQLQTVCERIGLRPALAEQVARECFNKLLHSSRHTLLQKVITFPEFINILHLNRNDCGLQKLSEANFFSEFQKAAAAHDDANEVNVRTRQVAVCNAPAEYNMSCNSAGKDIPLQIKTLPAQSVSEIWERVGIQNARGVLLTLGFDEQEINLSDLLNVIEEELRVLEGEPQTILLKASSALQSAELSALRQTLRQLCDENKKLHAGNKDANRRAALLAQEIDERHATLEENHKEEIRLLEQRHAEIVRELTQRLADDRENWTNLTTSLEQKLKALERNEIKLETELELINNENSALEEEKKLLQKKVTGLVQSNVKLNVEITDLRVQKCSSECSKNRFIREVDDEVVNLVDKIKTLQWENSNLRDKNDELVSAMEILNVELSREKTRNKKSFGATHSNWQSLEANSSATKLRDDTVGDCLAFNCELKKSDASSIGTNTDLTLTHIAAMDTLQQQFVEAEEEAKELKALDPNAIQERCKNLEAGMEQMQRAYEECEEYWQKKLSEERELFDKERKIYEDEQTENNNRFTELMEKVREYEEQYSRDGRLSPIEERDYLEQQYADLEAEAEEVRRNADVMLEEKSKEIEELQREVDTLRMRLCENIENVSDSGAADTSSSQKPPEMDAPANSPINYLWRQSTIQEPATCDDLEDPSTSFSPNKQQNCTNLSTSETTIFSTTPIDTTLATTHILPIQTTAATKAPGSESEAGDCDSSSTTSRKSGESQSVASTHSVHYSTCTRNNIILHDNSTFKSRALSTSASPSPSDANEEPKGLKFFEISLKEKIKDLSMQRDSLVMELQQLQEARPVLEKAYARTAHPTLMQRVNQLELRNRHLQNVIKQQQQYTQSLMQQTWQQHQSELNDLRSRIEAQSMVMAEQSQRLQNADILVKELYVENSHLTATVQLMEQQRARATMLHQQHSLNGLSGMP